MLFVTTRRASTPTSPTALCQETYQGGRQIFSLLQHPHAWPAKLRMVGPPIEHSPPKRRGRLKKPAELFKRFRGRASPPLAAPRRPDGTIAVGLKEVEETHHAAWNEYYNREGNPDHIVDTFLQRYADHLARSPPWIAPKITGADVLDAIHTWAPTAGGIDGTTPADMKHTSPEAAFWIAQHFRSIERNGGWPHDAIIGKHVQALTPEGDPLDPLNHRNLTILQWEYRCWANIRRTHIQSWLWLWIPVGFYTCAKGKGALDATLVRSLFAEYQRATGSHHSGGSGDIVKCYDEVIRRLASKLASIAGCDPKVVATHAEFQEHLRYYTCTHQRTWPPSAARTGASSGRPPQRYLPQPHRLPVV